MSCITLMKELVEMSTANEKDTESRPLLEILWYHHTIRHPVSSEAIDSGFAEMEPLLKPLSQKRKCRMYRLITELCVEHERAAFMEGIRVGGRLMMEIKEEDSDAQQKMS